jgi:hypothetical protein
VFDLTIASNGNSTATSITPIPVLAEKALVAKLYTAS